MPVPTTAQLKLSYIDTLLRCYHTDDYDAFMLCTRGLLEDKAFDESVANRILMVFDAYAVTHVQDNTTNYTEVAEQILKLI